MPDNLTSNEEANARIPTNLRTLLLLEALGQSDRAMTPTELNASVGLPKQTVHRLCATLEAEGFLVRDIDGKGFRAARRARLMGAGLLHAGWANIARHQVLRQLSQEVGETVNFVIAEGPGMRYLDRVDTDWSIQIQLPVGTNVPFHCTASGKVFMASLAPKARKAFVASLELTSHTSSTITSVDGLLSELKTVAKQGFAEDNEEFLDSMTALAVPVKDGRGRYVASLAVHGPAQRMSITQARAMHPKLKVAAERLREALFV